MTLETVGNVLLVAGAVPATGSLLIYGLGVTWWRSRWGRHLVAYMASVALVLDLGIVRLVFGATASWFAAVRVAAFALVVLALWWRLIYIVQAFREGSPDESRIGIDR